MILSLTTAVYQIICVLNLLLFFFILAGFYRYYDNCVVKDNSDFVDSVLAQSEEQYDRKQRLKQQGYNIDLIAECVAEVLEVEPEEVFSKGRQDWKVRARSLLCFWASRELGISHTELAKKLELSLAGVGFSVERGESIAKESKYTLEKK